MQVKKMHHCAKIYVFILHTQIYISLYKNMFLYNIPKIHISLYKM